ncbi:hypothetical protein [Myxococcus xanthus]|uniref:Uncharacterized protein n=1 Tax=Myxococcus xanthus TaxID=34 RepID=A0A7Y4II84_MYXXA|nr:hypothetical protein [Myxococcus xanthus]NOJ79644.1 hypothetical protein [Myxococcus xanthus]NOJ85934.1 hypothetical protein [Myxococcus xanthus]
MSPPSDYAEEAAEYPRLLRAAAMKPLETVLALGSGGGNASHLPCGSPSSPTRSWPRTWSKR